jgi:hypothetical protein
LIAALADFGILVGALASYRIKHVEFNRQGATIYLSKTRKANKTTPAKGTPLLLSTDHLINGWLYVLYTSFHGDPEAPLWIILAMDRTLMFYQSVLRNL